MNDLLMYKIALQELKIRQEKEPKIIWYIVGFYDAEFNIQYEVTRSIESFKKQLIEGLISDIDIFVGDRRFEFTARQG